LIRFLIQHNARSNVPCAFLCELLGIDKIEGLLVSKVDIVAEDVRVDKFPDVLLLVVAGETLVLELAPNLCHLLVNNLFFLVLSLRVSNVTNVEGETSHGSLMIA